MLHLSGDLLLQQVQDSYYIHSPYGQVPVSYYQQGRQHDQTQSYIVQPENLMTR